MKHASAHLITIEPTALYDTIALKDIVGVGLWNRIAPRLARPIVGMVLGEDLLAAIRAEVEKDRKRRSAGLPVDKSNESDGKQARKQGGEHDAGNDMDRGLSISLDSAAGKAPRAKVQAKRRMAARELPHS